MAKDNRYRLPKNRIVLPIISYSILFLLTIAVISITFEFVSYYAAELIVRSQTDATKFFADNYDISSDEDIEQILKAVDNSGYDWVIIDTDRNILRASGQPTIDLRGVDKDYETFIQKLVESGLDDEDEDIEISLRSSEDPEKELDITSEAIYFPDKDTDYLNVSEKSLSIRLRNVLMAENLFSDFADNAAYEIPYWTGFSVKGDSEIIAFKTSFRLTARDVFFFFLALAVFVTLASLVFIILLVNIIQTYLNAKKARRIMFSDNITRNRNWTWFVIKARDIIRRRRIGVQYAVVSLTFARYRNYILCHSIEKGEETLRKFSKIIDSNLEKKEISAHSTSANFPILIKANSEDQAREKVEKIINSLQSIKSDHDFKFQAGICMVDPKIWRNADIDLIYNNASAARMTLEGSDDTGIAFFDEKLIENEKWIDTVTDRQKDAVKREEFQVYYQPKYDPRTNELMGSEALIRWITDDLGFVPPIKFIPIFEKNGFITEIDHYMVTHVAQDQKKWLDEGRKCVPVSVNISRAHFSEIDLADQIRDIVDSVGTPHDLIEIELTESAFFDDKKTMIATITKLKEYGFLVSMDDFGAGYSSLNSLKDMPLDILKLDAGFFRGENNSQRTEIVVSEAIQLAKKLEMKTVAEGVEEKEQVDFLASEGCDMIQGYYYSKPLPKSEFVERITIVSDPEQPVETEQITEPEKESEQVSAQEEEPSLETQEEQQETNEE